MVREGVVVVLLATAAVAGCGVDPAPPQFAVGATPVGDGRIEVRVASCRSGRLVEVTVEVEGKGPDDGTDEPDLWRVAAEGDGGPEVAAGGVVDVVIGQPPVGLVEITPPVDPLPEHELIEVDVDLSSQSFGFFFRPEDLETGRYLHTGGDLTDDVSVDGLDCD